MEVREPSAKYLAKPAYKQTEVGLIPEDWRCISLAELAAKSANAIVGGPFGSDLVSKDYVATGTPVVRGQNMSRRYISGDFVFVSSVKAKHLQANTAVPGDIVFTQRGTLGQVALVPPAIFRRYVVSQSQMKVTLERELADPEYVLHYFLCPAGQKQIQNSAIQTGVPHTNLGILRSYKLPIPPTHAEQQAIAEALSDADALIESLEQLLAKKRQIKQGAMQELLTGQRRLPGFAGEWDSVALGDLFQFKNGLNKAKNFFGYGTPIVNYMDVFSAPKILCSGLEGRVSLTSQELKNFDVRKGDVLFTRTSETPQEVGMAAVILDDPADTVFSGFVLRGRPKSDRLCNEFKAHCLRASYVRAQIVSRASYTTRALTNGRLLSAVVLRVPNREEQAAIASVLSDMDTEVAAIEGKLVKARQIKQGMMSELLTGRIRLV